MGAMDDLDPQGAFELIPEATQRLVRTVDGLDDDALAEPSGLPDWTRAHVVAHLALNAEGLASVLRSRIEGEPTTMYPSDEARDADIEELAAGERSELRERFLAGTTLLDRGGGPASRTSWWPETFERTPGGRVIRYAAIPGMRLREVEIHHVDLAAGFAPTGWSDAFAAHLITAMVKRAAVRRGLPGAGHRPGPDLGGRRRARRDHRQRPRRRPGLVADRPRAGRVADVQHRRPPARESLVT